MNKLVQQQTEMMRIEDMNIRNRHADIGTKLKSRVSSEL